MLLHFNQQPSSSVCGVMVSIDAFQALDPGSIPGIRIKRSFLYLHFFNPLQNPLFSLKFQKSKRKNN
jgi:hypothetical protein